MFTHVLMQSSLQKPSTADDAVAVPEMLAIHHLPEMLNACWIFSDEKLRNVFDRSNHTSRVPFQSRLAPAKQTILVRHDFDKDPVSHASVTDESFDPGYLHGMSKLCARARRSEASAGRICRDREDSLPTYSGTSGRGFQSGAGRGCSCAGDVKSGRIRV